MLRRHFAKRHGVTMETDEFISLFRGVVENLGKIYEMKVTGDEIFGCLSLQDYMLLEALIKDYGYYTS